MHEEYVALDQSYAFRQEMTIIRNISKTSALTLPTPLKCLISKKRKKKKESFSHPSSNSIFLSKDEKLIWLRSNAAK